MPIQISSVLSYALIAAGFLVIILASSVSLMRREIVWTVVALIALGAFLVAAPLIQTFRVDQTGVSIETVGRAIVAAGDTADKSADAVNRMQTALSDMKKQVDDLAAQQKTIVAAFNQSAANGAHPPIETKATDEVLQRQSRIQDVLQSTGSILQDLNVANQANKAAISNVSKALKF